MGLADKWKNLTFLVKMYSLRQTGLQTNVYKCYLKKLCWTWNLFLVTSNFRGNQMLELFISGLLFDVEWISERKVLKEYAHK